jgi:hypothetical protein
MAVAADMRGDERKPSMDEDKRKVLDLLEFCSELCPSLRVCQIINNAIPSDVLMRRDTDTYYITDSELAGWLQEFADLMLTRRED